VIEKPFGRDLESAVILETRLRDTFADESIFRVDHYLAKEPVEGLQILRFDNELFEPVWNRQHIAAVEVTLAEQLGTEHRPGFYDDAGAIRDVLQNHVLQIVALLAMERPVDDTVDAFHDSQALLLQQVRPLASTDTLRAQYDGYRDQVGVAPTSTTETFVAAELCIDSDRWAGVPFRVRAGKRMAQTATEAVVVFKRPSRLTSVQPAGGLAEPDIVRLRLGSDDGVTISLQAKSPGRGPVSRPVHLSVDFTEAFGRRQDAYERLLDDVMDGTRRRFARFDTIAQQWRIVADVLDLPDIPTPYQPGSWGPNGHHRLGTAAWRPIDLAVGTTRGMRRNPAFGHTVNAADQKLAG
jgi:glucose-6-phosphate 1-dehydrogenase